MRFLLKYLGVVCLCLSLWGMIQLSIMGLCYYLEAAVLIEDVHAHAGTYHTFKEYITKTRRNYRRVAINCWIAALGYVGVFVVSLVCVLQAKSRERELKSYNEDEETICMPPMPPEPITIACDLPTKSVSSRKHH